jgi:hypothetical protein
MLKRTMPQTTKYTCSCCGKQHEGWPALTYASPSNYNGLSEEDKQNLGELTSDFCIIRYPDQIDRFIRCTLTQKVIDHCDDLEYGLWVSLSEKSFEDYSQNYNNESREAAYFGWLCNDLPDYSFDESVPTTVYTRTGNQRPEIVPNDNFDHPFVHDYYNGITKKEAEKRIREMLKNVAERDKARSYKKPWWKVW